MVEMTVLEVQGMTCMGCVRNVKGKLEAVDGVAAAEVDLESGTARVAGSAPEQALIDAVAQAGKVAKVRQADKAPETVLEVQGMTCGGCVRNVTNKLLEVDGVVSAEVDLESGLARVTGSAAVEALTKAVGRAGKIAKAVENAGESGNDVNSYPGSPPGSREITLLRVTKMPCGGCRKKVTEALQNVEGTEDTFVSLKEQLAVTMGTATPEALQEAVVAAGKVPELLYTTTADTAVFVRKLEGVSEDNREELLDTIANFFGVDKAYVQPAEQFLAVIGDGFSEDAVTQAVKRNGGILEDLLLPVNEVALGNVPVAEKVVAVRPAPAPQPKPTSQEGSAGATPNGKGLTNGHRDYDKPLNGTAGQSEGVAEVYLKVTGMTCASCVGIVEDVLLKTEGVEAAKVNLMASRAVVTYRPKIVELNTVINAVNKSGYRAEKLEQSKNLQLHLRFHEGGPMAERALEFLQGTHPVVKFSIVRTKAKQGWKWLKLFDGSRTGGREKDVLLRAEVARDDLQNLHDNVFIDIYQELLKSHRFGAVEVVSLSDEALNGDRNPSYLLSKAATKYFLLFISSFLLSLPIFAIKLIGNPEDPEKLMKHNLLLWVLATPVQFLCGWTFYRGAYYALRRGRANMDTLVALGTSVAYFFSMGMLLYNLFAVTSVPEKLIFDTGVLLTTVVLFGKWLETSAKKRTAIGITELENLKPSTATFMTLENGNYHTLYEDLSVDLALPGDFVRVKPGERCPIDGVIVRGTSSLNESMLTGESKLVDREVGDSVFAGTENSSSLLVLKAVAVGKDTLLSRVAALVEDAQTSRAKVEEFSDRVSAVFVPIVVTLATLTTVLWLTLCHFGAVPEAWYESEGATLFSLMFGLSVLVVACPCALGLATPTVVMVATSVGAQHRILFKHGGASLENAERIFHVVFDKTGTLTAGEPHVTSIQWFSADVDEKDAMNVISTTESASNHPLGKAIRQYILANFGAEGDKAMKWSSVAEGKGISAFLSDGRRVDVGSPTWLENLYGSWDYPNEESPARTVVVAAINGKVVVHFELEDKVREEARRVVSHLQDKMGVSVHMLTGDNMAVAQNVAMETNMPRENIIAGALPWTKVDVVENLKGSLHGVAFVGDGINDAPALAAADVGIAIGAGTDIAIDAASVVLVDSSLEDTVIALDIARRALKRIRGNFFWALCYNILAVPVAAGVFFPLTHQRLPPTLAAAMMALSSISVVTNALLLRQYTPPTIGAGRANGKLAQSKRRGRYQSVVGSPRQVVV